MVEIGLFCRRADLLHLGGFPNAWILYDLTIFLLDKSKGYARTQPALQPNQRFEVPS